MFIITCEFLDTTVGGFCADPVSPGLDKKGNHLPPEQNKGTLLGVWVDGYSSGRDQGSQGADWKGSCGA